MSEYTNEMSTEEMREEIADMMECGEGFIASHETLLEYVDDFIAKVRADAIDEVIKGLKEEFTKQNNPHSKYIRTIVANEGIFDALEQIKEQKNETSD